MNSTHMLPNRRHLLAGAAATAATVAAPAILRAQGGPLKVGVLLPRSGFEAGIGQDCQRGVDIAPGILKSLGLPDLTIMNGDTESNVDTAREHAEKLISDGAQLLVGAFDSGQTTAIAQVAEQKGIPLVINIAGAPDITEQGYKFVFRNFPTAPMLTRDGFAAARRTVFDIVGKAPKTVVFMRVNDTFGTAMSKARRRDDAEVQYALHDRRRDFLRSGGARPFGRGDQGQGHQRRRHASSSAASTTPC